MVTNFSTIDWIIVCLYVLGSLLIGIFVRQYSRDMTNFIGAGRSVGPWLGIATMTGTEMGLITVMYNAQAGYKDGFAAFHIGVLAGIVTLLIGLTGFIVVPLREMKVLTIPEFYERRYGRQVRILGGVVLATAGILNMGLFLKVGSMFVVGVAGLGEQSDALLIVMTTLITLVLVYTMLGGMISVIITDYIQFVVLSFGLLLTTILAIRQLGWQTILDTVSSGKGPEGFNPVTNEAFGPEYILWMAITAGLVSCAVWPTAVARALAMESGAAVRKQYAWSSLSFAIRFIVPMFWGICAFTFFSQNQELAEGLPEEGRNLYAMPYYLSQLLPTGLLGIVTAAMLAAFMSTQDSYLLCWSSVISQDIVSPLSGGTMSEKGKINLTRLLILLIGIFVWAWGMFYEGDEKVWDYMAITGAIYFTGAIPVLVGGIYWRGASSTGAMAALACGGLSFLGLEQIREGINKQIGGVVELTAARVGLLTLVTTCIVFVVVSLLAPDPPKTMEDK